jgi:error-prone DNA polymerase
VAGVGLVRQRPGSANGVTFLTLEDETGVANLIVYENIFERYRPIARDSTVLLAHGRVERQGSVVHVITFSFTSLDLRLQGLASQSRNFR